MGMKKIQKYTTNVKINFSAVSRNKIDRYVLKLIINRFKNEYQINIYWVLQIQSTTIPMNTLESVLSNSIL